MNLHEITIRGAIAAMWAGWIGYWLVAAGNVKRTRWREPVAARALHNLPLVVCAALLAAPSWLPPVLARRLVAPGPALPAVGTVLVALGLALAVWARIHLGRNWSGQVVVKEDHALIRSGPYRVVRHPIYSGLLLALLGTAAALDEWRGIAALGFALVGILVRVHAEEARMRQTFPEYADYRRRTAALIPGIF